MGVRDRPRHAARADRRPRQLHADGALARRRVVRLLAEPD